MEIAGPFIRAPMSSRNILLRCPFCRADRWGRLVTSGAANSGTLEWRCTHCLQEWVEFEGTVLPPRPDTHQPASTVAPVDGTRPKSII